MKTTLKRGAISTKNPSLLVPTAAALERGGGHARWLGP
jgi:hypothetical protein